VGGQLGEVGKKIGDLQQEQSAIRARMENLAKLVEFQDFSDLDWPANAREISRLKDEWAALEAASDVLATLTQQLKALEEALKKTEMQLIEQRDKRSKTEQKITDAKALRRDAEGLMAQARQDFAEQVPRLEALQHQMQSDAQGEAKALSALTVESCDAREREMRDGLQKAIDVEDGRAKRVLEKIIDAMRSFSNRFPVETQEVDVSVGSAHEYRHNA
jgi:uncharacterized protein YPO0396